ncbi:RTA1 domain-containing protein [Phanerochaete sordida]|uniref:RTA1 domain-containing protein n=1 Tax=Phanerochaete sordida TaxID=48140 RepID=A0A9P3G1W7_9APHY|nr:RTA1 domain-containing protein [Phanerochaete sordida]
MPSTATSPSAVPSLTPSETSPYGYVPTRGVCIAFVVLFGFSALLHLVTAIRFRLWWLVPTACLMGAGEVIGWVGRLWSSMNVMEHTPFTMQIVCTILAPTPLLAAIFIIFTRMTQILGVRYSRLTPRWYTAVFLTCDIVALVIQGLGGGIAADAKTISTTNLGANVMLAGIVFQLVAMLAFSTLAAEYFYRFAKDRPIRGKDTSTANRDSVATAVNAPRPWDKRHKLMALGLTISTTFLIIRGIYRTIELGDGWNGKVLRTEVYFTVFDAAMVAVSTYSLNLLNPGVLLYSRHSVRDSEEDYQLGKMSP